MEEFIISDLVEVKVIRFFCVNFYWIVKLFAKILVSALLEFPKPEFNVFNSLVNNILESVFFSHQSIDGAHEEGEDNNAQEFNQHLVQVLWRLVSFEVTIANCCQGSYNPIDRWDIHNIVVSFIKYDSHSTTWIKAWVEISLI